MTTSQRDAINSPAEGLQIYNTTTLCLEIFIGTVWQSIFCGCDQPPALPAAGTHSPSQTQITWSWNVISGATGYKWSTANIYSSASDVGTSLNYIQTGLTCNSS